MRRLFAVAVLACSSLALFAADAPAQVSSPSFAAGSSAFSEGDYLRALAHFQAARDAGTVGPAVHYNIAVCHYKLGNYAEAESVFRFVADEYPAMRALAQYNVGLALQKRGRESDAQSFFREARDGGDERVASLAAAMLTVEEPHRGPSAAWMTFVDLNLGHDDNVALLDETTLPAGQSVESPFTEMSVNVTGPLDRRKGFRLDGSAYSARYDDASQFDQDVFGLRTPYRWGTGNWSGEAGPHFTYSTVDGNGFEQHLGLGISVKHLLSARTSFGLQVAHEEVDDLEARYAYVEGSRDSFGLTWEHRDESRRMSLGYDFESNSRQDPRVSPTRNRVWMRYRQTVNEIWTIDLYAAHRGSAYNELQPSADEDFNDFYFGLARNLGERWQLNAKYRWSDNDSGLPNLSYTRNRIALGLTASF
jgi:hypothetical protein